MNTNTNPSSPNKGACLFLKIALSIILAWSVFVGYCDALIFHTLANLVNPPQLLLFTDTTLVFVVGFVIGFFEATAVMVIVGFGFLLISYAYRHLTTKS